MSGCCVPEGAMQRDSRLMRQCRRGYGSPATALNGTMLNNTIDTVQVMILAGLHFQEGHVRGQSRLLSPCPVKCNRAHKQRQQPYTTTATTVATTTKKRPVLQSEKQRDQFHKENPGGTCIIPFVYTLSPRRPAINKKRQARSKERERVQKVSRPCDSRP